MAPSVSEGGRGGNDRKVRGPYEAPRPRVWAGDCVVLCVDAIEISAHQHRTPISWEDGL